MDLKEWLTKAKTLLALNHCDEFDEDWFKIWFEQGYSPGGAAYKYRLLYGVVPFNFYR